MNRTNKNNLQHVDNSDLLREELRKAIWYELGDGLNATDVDEAIETILTTISKHLPENVLEEPRLFQGSGGDSAPFFCSLCGMGEMQIMGRKEDDRYYCHCSYWSDPHNAYLDKSGGRWLGWFDKDAAQKIIDGLPTISVDEVNKLLEGE